MRNKYIIITIIMITAILVSTSVGAISDSNFSSGDSDVPTEDAAPEDNNDAEVNYNTEDENNDDSMVDANNNNEEYPGNNLPVADFVWSANGEVITFESTSHDLDGDIVQYWWWYDDPEQGVCYPMSTQPMFDYVFAQPGSYAVSLKVADDDGASDIVTKTVLAYIIVPPVADFTWTPSLVQEGDIITFDGSGSYDADGEIVQYIWWYDDPEQSVCYLMSKEVVFDYSFEEPGSYDIYLKVVDNDGASDIITKTLTYVFIPEVQNEEQEESESQEQPAQQTNTVDEIQRQYFVFIRFSTVSAAAEVTGISGNTLFKISFLQITNITGGRLIIRTLSGRTYAEGDDIVEITSFSGFYQPFPINIGDTLDNIYGRAVRVRILRN